MSCRVGRLRGQQLGLGTRIEDSTAQSTDSGTQGRFLRERENEPRTTEENLKGREEGHEIK